WARRLLETYWDGLPIRRIGVSLTQLTPDNEYQLSLFDTDRERQMALERTTDALKLKYGNAIVIRAVSKTAVGQALDRSAKIGGHYK
ncbi:DNA polymerase IV, partial [Paenibacillus sp. Dod16]